MGEGREQARLQEIRLGGVQTMKYIRYTVFLILFAGGLLLAAVSCEAFNLIGMAVGVAMLWAGAMLANQWEEMER